MSKINKLYGGKVVGVSGRGMSWHSKQVVLMALTYPNVIILDPKGTIMPKVNPDRTVYSI